MIVAIVRFDLPPGTTRDMARALYDQSARGWLGNPDLVEKYYLFDAERSEGGGIYVWRSHAAVERWHGADYRAMVAARYGSAPRIEVFEAPLRLDPASGTAET
ncbi:monooxygenase [Bradyrhizobium genosp. L]|uniref:monooxygenase n=1 Tax=Bradyrhizobium genosp. L TaxID=83637 RepID=UPI0018A31434|nr:monooxygenase [Bradyrhizobium genosp. L]QPF87173.1 monooxygenase [Bradyrhizobium genosp. L]